MKFELRIADGEPLPRTPLNSALKLSLIMGRMLLPRRNPYPRLLPSATIRAGQETGVPHGTVHTELIGQYSPRTIRELSLHRIGNELHASEYGIAHDYDNESGNE